MGRAVHTTRKGTIPYLTVREVGCLDCAMTNREARPHRQILQGMQSPAFNGYVYKYWGKNDQKVVQWVRKRGIDLRGFTLEVRAEVRSGPVLVTLVGVGYYPKYFNLELSQVLCHES